MRCPICAEENEGPVSLCFRCGVPLGEPTDTGGAARPIGTTLGNGAYLLTAVIGRGGFGIIYLGTDTRLKRRVAIKQFLDDKKDGRSVEADRGRFQEEAQLLARFQHPNIIAVHSSFEEDGAEYMVTEFLQGRSLQDIVERDGALSPQTALTLIAPVCDALDAMHQVGVLHRDIKPQNIVRCLDQRIVLIDFGSARDMHELNAAAPVTLTPGYAPLEQYSAQARLGVYTDLYALGATLYFLLTGKAPLDAAARGRKAELTPPNAIEPGIGPQINKVILWAMEMRVEDRPASVAAWRAALFAETASIRDRTAPITMAQSGGSLPLTALAGHDAPVTAVVFSADGRYLATGGADNIVNIWETGTWIHRQKLRHASRITSLAVSPHEDLLVSAGFFDDVKVWNMASGTPIGELKIPLLTQFFATNVSTVSMAIAPDGKTLFTATGSLLLVWNLETGELMRQVKEPVYHISISPDGRMLACCVQTGARSDVELWDTADDQVLFTIAKRLPRATSLHFAPDNRHLVCSLQGGSIMNWDLEEKDKSRSQLTSPVECVAHSPDGTWLASAGANGTVYLWRATQPGLLGSFPAHAGAVHSMAFSPDSHLLATAGADTSVKIWRML